MDLWCAMWFWPLTETERKPPSLEEWTDAVSGILGVAPSAKNQWMDTFGGDSSTWDGLNSEEADDLNWAGAQSIAAVREKNPWITVGEEVATGQGFFHWALDFAAVFAQGGFDLQVGNPPWVRPTADVDSLLAEGDPWWQLAVKPSETERAARRAETTTFSGVVDLVTSATGGVIATREFVGETVNYPHLGGLQPDLYRCFMSQVWAHGSDRGISSLIHPESHFTEDRAGRLRALTYRHLRRHWQFINELILFEVDDKALFGVHVYGKPREVKFWQAVAIYHPETVERSFHHDGSGDEPGYKDPAGDWDRRPHLSRILRVDKSVLDYWRDVLEPDSSDSSKTRMLGTVNSAAARTLLALSRNRRIRDLELRFSSGWHEKADRSRGRFETQWGPASWREAILQGPHIHICTPLFKSVNSTMKHNQDWTATDFEALTTDALPVTAYKPAGDPIAYRAFYTRWQDFEDAEVTHSARDYYRIAWRRMAANTGERTLVCALIPPGATHVHAVNSGALLGERSSDLVQICGLLSSLLADFSVRSAPKGDIHGSTINRLPRVPIGHGLAGSLTMRSLRLNCVTAAYTDLWRESWDEAFHADSPVLPQVASGPLGPQWNENVPLRRAMDRRNALIEIDALVALMLGVSIDDLCTIYRTQFAVLYGYDHHEYTYDVNGRLVPNSVLSVWRKKGDRITEEERTAVHPGSGVAYTYELPFGTLDREADMRAAYAEFERRLAALKGQER